MEEDNAQSTNTKEQNIKSCWSNFTSEATLHGVNKLSGSYVRIICWTLVIFVSFVYLTYNLTTELQKYYSYPVQTQVKVEFHEEMVFPAVTICNLCWRNKSLQDNSSQAQTFYSAISSIPKMFPPINWSDPFYKENGYFEPWTADQYYSESMTMRKVIRICWFDEHKPVSCESTFEVIRRFGTLCYSFNLRGDITTKHNGPEYNLRVYIRINSDFYTWGRESASGIKIFVHEPNTVPVVETGGYRAFTGTSTYVEVIKKKYVYQQKPYQAFKNKYCETHIPGTEVHSGLKVKYTYDVCQDICKRRIVENMCRCHLLEGRRGKYPICSKYEYETCYLPTLVEVSTNKSLVSSCGCQHPCEYSDYFISVTYAEFPSDFMRDQLSRIFMSNLNKIRGNDIMLHVYYKHLLTDTLLQEPVYSSIGDVLANIGGQMGLFLGASIMSFLELGELLGKLVFVIWKRQQKTRKIQQKSKTVEITEHEGREKSFFVPVLTSYGN